MNVLREKRVRKEQKLENKKKEEKERKKGNFKIVMIVLRALDLIWATWGCAFNFGNHFKQKKAYWKSKRMSCMRRKTTLKPYQRERNRII